MILDETEVDNDELLDGGEWSRERWWNGLIQVCRRWRYIVLESAFHLRISLVCARGTPVADMLAHSPLLPIIIDHLDDYDNITPEDEEGIILALQHRDRVRRIRLGKAVPILQKLTKALDGEFPILEYLLIEQQRYQKPRIEPNTHLNLPETFRAPHLRQLILTNFAIPIESPMLTTMGNLVALSLNSIPSSAYFHPAVLLQRLLLMPQLETLGIFFNSYDPNRERQLSRTRIMTRVTLPNLRWLGYQGTSAYLEALLPWVSIPLLEKLQVYFFNRLIYSIPRLEQLLSAARNLRLKTTTVTFDEDFLSVMGYPNNGAKMYSLDMKLGGKLLDWQVVSAAQVLQALRKVFSAVEHLTLEYDREIISSEWVNQDDHTQWREVFGSFSNVKTLFVDGELVRKLSRALQPSEGGSSTELLPELQELSSSAKSSLLDVFTPFVEARQKAGRTVTMIRP